MIIVAGRSHPLARQPVVTPLEVAQQPFIYYSRDSQRISLLEERLRLDEEHVLILVHDREVDARVRLRLPRLFAHALELVAEHVGLARTLVQIGECLAPGGDELLPSPDREFLQRLEAIGGEARRDDGDAPGALGAQPGQGGLGRRL